MILKVQSTRLILMSYPIILDLHQHVLPKYLIQVVEADESDLILCYYI